MIDKKLQEKWEKRLQKLGLGVDQPMTDNSEGEFELEQADSMPSVRNEKHPDHARLRAKIDSNDKFLSGGFEIKSIRSLNREVPEWALNNKEVQRILLTAFPKLSLVEPSNKQAKKAYQKRIAAASKWAQVINLYYRMMLPQQVVAKELKISERDLKNYLQRIGKVAAGFDTLGRPRKKINTPPPTNEGTGRKGNEAK